MHAAFHFHVNLGDLPTWLAVIFAAVAAAVAFSQLRGQQKELTRQLSALERQQANQVNVHASSQGRRLPGDEPGMTPTSCWDLVVGNRSRRPIRTVAASIDATGSDDLSPPDQLGLSVQGEPIFVQPKDGEVPVPLLRVEQQVVFVFPHPGWWLNTAKLGRTVAPSGHLGRAPGPGVSRDIGVLLQTMFMN
jgi:type II secretory pathway pseudopilin PulG